MKIQTSLLTAVLAALAATAQAQSPDFSWHGTLAAGKTIEIRGVNGRVEAGAATGNTVEVTAVKRARRSDPDEVKIEVVESDEGVTICAVYPTPRRSRHDNHCGAGDDYEMTTNNNDVEVQFTVKVPRGVRLDAATVNGDIRVTEIASDAELHTVNGGIDVVAGGIVRAETVNGDIDARMGQASWTGTLEFKTVNGSVSLTAPASLSTDIDAETVNGSVDSDFPITVQGRMERRHLRGTIGAGGRNLEIETVNGGIELRKGA